MADFWEQFETVNNDNKNNYWTQFPEEDTNEEVYSGVDTLGKLGATTISATPKRNLITDFQECLNWVNKTRFAAYQEGKEQVEIADLETKDMLKLASEKELERLDELNNKPENNYNIPEKRKYIDRNETNFIPRVADTISIGAKKGYVEALKMIPYMWETIKATAGGTAIGATGGALVGLGTGLMTTKANAPHLALQGARVGGSWGGRISGSMKLAELEGGLARNELRQINNEIIQEGGEPLENWEINALAVGVGGVNAGLEYVGLRQVLKTVPNGDKILNYFEKKQLRELAKDKTVREQLRGVLGQYAKTIATEMTTEMAQETTNIVAEHAAQKLGKVECTPLEQNVARVLDTGKATFGATLYLGAVGSAGKVAMIKTKQGIDSLQAKKEAESMTEDEKEEFIANNLDTLVETVNDIPEVKDLENRNKLKEMIESENGDVEKRKKKAIEYTSNKWFTQGGIKNKKTSDAAAELFVNMLEKVSESKGIPIDVLIQNEIPDIESRYENFTGLNQLAQTAGAEYENNNQNIYYQAAAMYKSPKKSFEDFYNQVQSNISPKQKAYYTQTTKGGVNIDIFHDIVRHDDKKHSLSKDEWNELFGVIDNGIEEKLYANKSYYKGTPILLKIKSGDKYFGVSMEIFPERAIITTAFKSTSKGVDTWIEKDKKKSAKTTAPNHQSRSSVTNSNNVILGQTLNNIINDVKANLKSNENNRGTFDRNNQNIYYQTGEEYTNIDGTKVENPLNPLDYDYVHTQFKNVWENEQEKIKLEINPDIENRSNEIIKTKELKNTNLDLLRTKENSVKNIENSIKKYLFGNNKNTTVTNNSTSIEAIINSHSIHEMINEANNVPNKQADKAGFRAELYNIVANSKELFNSAEYILTYKELKKAKLKDTLKVSKYANIVETKFGNYIVEFTVFENNKENSIKIYDLESIAQNESSGDLVTKNATPSGTNISIAQLRDFVKSRVVEKYNNDYKKAKEIKKYPPDNESGNADKFKNVKGYYIPAEKLIVLLKNADESTIIHELGHLYLDLLSKYSGDNEEINLDLQEARKFLKNEGEPFTEEQHEKFARAFEAYIRSGYAKTNRLKKIFEDFKNMLMSIYDSIKNIVYKENGIDKTFTDEELENIQNLFDRLFTTERERIKTTIFDKISEIDNKIEKIKNHEAEEFKELDNIWRENTELLNRKSDIKRSVQEYLELAEKMTSRESKEVKEFKQRYKNATLDILSVISGQSRSWVANSRNWEKLQEIVGGAGDEITASGGFRPEWGEFYADTGVSYENDEIDGDYKLGEQALNVLFDGNYNKTFDENYEFADINKFMAKFDYLAAKVRTLKGTEKEAAYEALTSLFGDIPAMPDEVFISISDELEKIGNELEEQQKNDFNKKRYPSIPVVQQLQWYITNKLNELKVYNPETRYKMRLNRSHRLYRYIKNVNSVDSAKKQIRKINDYVIDDMRNNQRSLLHKEIQRQVKVNSKVVKVGSLTKGKFDWKTNTVFAELVQLNRLSREEAEEQLGAMVNIDNAANSEGRDSFDEADSGEFDKSGDFQKVLKNEFLQYKSQKLRDLDVTHTIQLLQDILELKQKGRQAKSEEDFLNKTQRWNTKNNLLDILEQTKQSGAQFGANWIAGVGGKLYNNENTVANWFSNIGHVAGINGGVLANWESLLNAIFDKATAQKYSLLGDEARSEVYARKHMLHFYKKAAEIYGFNNPTMWDKFIDFDYMQPIINLMREYENEKYTYTQRVFSINTPSGYAESSIEISRAQMITMFAWSLNDELEQRLFSQFGLNQIRDMFESKLSKQDKDLAWALVDTCETMREDINEVFIRTTGLSLPKVQNYFPSKAERVQSDIDMYHDFFVKSSNPSFIKQRKTCNRIPMRPMSPLEILIPHINKTAKYVILSEKTNFMNQVFKDTAIKTKMQEIWGSESGAKIYQTLINKLAACTFTNYAKGTNLVANALDTVSRNYISSRIGFSAKVAIGQLLSVVNYAENMPAGVWAKGFTEVLKHPVDSFKYMLENCEYLQTRLAGNTQNEIISILTSEKDRFRTLRNFMSTNTKWGDIIAITLGGKPYVDWLMKQGMNKEDAFNKFLEDTLRAQQAGTTSSISEWQSAQARNCLTRMFFAFQNTTIQYERKFVDTLIQAKKGEISKKEAAKKLFIYKILNPIMFTSFLQNLSLLALFRGLAGGDDDDTVLGFLRNIVESIFISGMGAYGFAGLFASVVIESIIANLDSGYKHFEKGIPILTDFEREIQKFIKGDLEFADYVEALALGSDYGLGIAGTKVTNVLGGVGNIAQGDFGVGALRMAGWGEYTSTKAWTGEEPEKKKRKKRKRS